MDNVNKEQLVSLKVMRLLKPSFQTSMNAYTDEDTTMPSAVAAASSSSLYTQSLLKQTFVDHTQQHFFSSPHSAHTDLLVIPQIFGNLYIGETFTSYICLHNHSQQRVGELSVKVELQTVTQKVALPFKSGVDFVDKFEVDQKFDAIVEHDVKELGNHILICLVSYMTERQERMQFKKFYKFVVSKPFEIQPRFPFLSPSQNAHGNCVLVEAQIQNITSSILHMERVELLPMPSTAAATTTTTTLPRPLIEHIDVDNKQSDSNAFASMLRPLEVRQYLFRIVYPRSIDEEPKPLLVGRLDISWRNSFGEHGHLQTHPLAHNTDVYNLSTNRDIQLSFDEFSSQPILVDQIVHFTCHIRNKSERELDLHMKLTNDKSFDFIWSCGLMHDVGKIAAGHSVAIRLSLVPFRLGLLSISGISITDMLLKRVHEFNQCHNAYILASSKQPPPPPPLSSPLASIIAING